MFLKGRPAARPGTTFSYIGSEVTVTGDIRTEGELHVDGTVTGDVRCGALTQGAGSEVRGNIQAETARLAGFVDGAVEAGALTLEASARVTGDILYETVAMAEGAEVDGRFKRRRSGGGSTAAREEAPKAERAKREPAAPTPLFGGEQAAEAAE
jgi:cytoskeletal protein CcmA (bactofilin family)